MSEDSIRLNGFKEIQQVFSANNKEMTEEDLLILFENSLEEGETSLNIDKFVQNIAENYDIDSIEELHQLISNIAQTDGDEENLSLEDLIYEEEEGSKTDKINAFDESELDEKWQPIEAETDKALGFLWETGTYTYKTSNGVDITVSDTTDIEIYENKETGEVIVVGAKGAKINSSSEDAKLTIYDSEIESIDTGKGNDNVKIYNSSVGNLSTGKGTDSITIENSEVRKINTGSGNDFVSVSDSNISNVNTSSSFLFGILDDGEDTVILNDSQTEEVKTGRGNDNIIATNSSVNNLDTGSGSNSLSTEEADIGNLSANKHDTVIKDKNYIDIDKSEIQGIESDSQIMLEDGTSISVNDYANYILSQEVGFETEEEYQEYVIDSMKANLESIKSTFDMQEASDGVVSDGYNLLKELTGLGITNEDVESLIAEQEAMIEGLTAALNGKSGMTFEEAYEYYTGTTYSKEKIDKYMEVSQIYSAVMVGCQYDEDYMEKFEEATGKSIEDISKEYALCQMETFGRSTGIQDLVEKYAEDQNSFADRLSMAISAVGITCIVAGAVVSFVFPPAAPAGMALMTAGKYISLSGMFIDNAMDLVDGTTDADGLTKEEIGDIALETGVEAISYMAGRGIGKLTNGLNSVVTNKAASAGMGKVGSYVVGQTAETAADAALSLGADFVIAQGQSVVTTGQFMDADDYWSMDRFLGEGKNQLIGILTGLASSKVNAYQQGVISTAQGKILSGDIEGAKEYIESSGMKMTDTDFDGFVEQVKVVDAEAKITNSVETDITADEKIQDENQVKSTETEENVETESKVVSTDSDSKINQENLTDVDGTKVIDSSEVKSQIIEKYNFSDSVKEYISNLDDVQYQRLVELFDKLPYDIDISELDIRKINMFASGVIKIDCEDQSITYKKTKEGDFKVEYNSGKKKIKEIIYLSDGSRQVSEGFNESERVVSLYNGKNILLTKSNINNSDNTPVLQETYTYKDGTIIKNSKYVTTGIETQQILDSSMRPIGQEIVKQVNLPDKIKSKIIEHISTPNQIDNTGFIYGGHFIDDYLSLKDGSSVELTLRDGTKTTADIEIDDSGNITYSYKIGDVDFKLKLEKEENPNGIILYTEKLKRSDLNSNKLCYKTVVSSVEYDKMFELLAKNSIDKFCMIEENGSKYIYYYTISDNGEYIYWRLLENGGSLYPVTENMLPEGVKDSLLQDN